MKVKPGLRTVLNLYSVAPSSTDSVRIFSLKNGVLWLGNMFRSLFGLVKSNCIKLFKIKVKAYIKYTVCLSDVTITNIGRNM